MLMMTIVKFRRRPMIALSLLMVVAIGGIAGADIGGYRLMDTTGYSPSRPTEMGSEVRAQSLPEVIDHEPTSLNKLTAQAVKQAEAILRRRDRDDQTTAQNADLHAARSDELRRVLAGVVGRPIEVSFEVVDVVDRPRPPSPPAPPPRFESLPDDHPSRKAHEAAMELHRRERALWDRSRMMVVGRLNWRSSLKLSQSQRDVLAKASDQRTVSLRAAFQAGLPTHYIYLFGSGDEIRRYRRGQGANVTGFVQRGGLFSYFPRSEQDGRDGWRGETCVGAEWVVWAAEAPATRPATRASTGPSTAPGTDE